MDVVEFLSWKEPSAELGVGESLARHRCLLVLTCHAQISPALSILTKLVFSLDDEVLIDACWAISYLSDGSNDKIQAVIESGVVRRLVELLMWVSSAPK